MDQYKVVAGFYCYRRFFQMDASGKNVSSTRRKLLGLRRKVIYFEEFRVGWIVLWNKVGVFGTVCFKWSIVRSVKGLIFSRTRWFVNGRPSFLFRKDLCNRLLPKQSTCRYTSHTLEKQLRNPRYWCVLKCLDWCVIQCGEINQNLFGINLITGFQ